jgi:hypothetical protein
VLRLSYGQIGTAGLFVFNPGTLTQRCRSEGVSAALSRPIGTRRPRLDSHYIEPVRNLVRPICDPRFRLVPDTQHTSTPWIQIARSRRAIDLGRRSLHPWTRAVFVPSPRSGTAVRAATAAHPIGGDNPANPAQILHSA